MTPFPLSPDDAKQFINDVGYDALYSMPDWGAIIQWNGRYVLAFKKVDGTFALSDVSGGIPDSAVPGGVIPIQSVVANVPRTQGSLWGVFFYSLPQNFMSVARENAIAAAQGAGAVIGDVTGAIVSNPLADLGIAAVVGVLVLFYLAKR